MDDLYRENILQHYKHPHHWGELADPDYEAEDNNPLCGDELKVQLRTDDDGRIEEVRFSGQGCAISQASASMVSDEIKGMTPGELLRLDRDFVLDGVHPHDVAEILGRDGVCVRAGHHCAQPLMRRLGVPASSRASFAVHSTPEEVDRLVEGLHHVRRVFQLD